MEAILRTVRENLSPARLAVLGFTIAYMVAGGLYFLSVGNGEFVGYAVLILMLVLLGGCVLTHQCVPVWLLFLLSTVGLLHMLGAGVMVDGDVLYNSVPFPIENPTGLTIIKFDQIVHTYASGVVAVLAYYFLRRDTRFHWLGIATLSILASMGAGAINEIVEFVAKLTVPDSNVGGYYNTAMDLTVNLVGAITGTLLAFASWRPRPVIQHPAPAKTPNASNHS